MNEKQMKLKEHNKAIIKLLEKIKENIYDNPPENFNYGHVGDAERVRKDLENIVEYFC